MARFSQRVLDLTRTLRFIRRRRAAAKAERRAVRPADAGLQTDQKASEGEATPDSKEATDVYDSCIFADTEGDAFERELSQFEADCEEALRRGSSGG